MLIKWQIAFSKQKSACMSQKFMHRNFLEKSTIYRREQHVFLLFFAQVVLGCFFEAKLKLFAGCVIIRQDSSIIVKFSQESSRWRDLLCR